MFAVIATMVAVWLMIVLLRNPIRAHWWTRQLITTTDPQARLAYFHRIVALGPGGAAAVETLLNHPDAAIRSLGVAVLNHTKPLHARSLLAQMIDDPDADVGQIAVTGLAVLGDDTVVDELKQLLDSPNPQRAVLAITGLSRLRTPEAIDALIATAEAHPHLAARVQAIEELGQLQVERAREALLRCLEDTTPFTGLTISERSAAALLQRASPTSRLTSPPSSRPVSDFAAQALLALTPTESP
ncbi:MAG: HEAT repeat domain-containing protein [bacterium]|nr:HEAT repeat domain-containing protein [bacterium]